MKYFIEFSDQLPEPFYTRLIKVFTNNGDCVLHIYANVVAMLRSAWCEKRIAFVLEPKQVPNAMLLLVKDWIQFGLHAQSELIVEEMYNRSHGKKVNKKFH